MTSTGKENQGDGEREGGGLIPAILAGAGLLVVAGLLIFGGNGGEEDEAGTAKAGKGQSAGADHESGAKGGPKGGIGARPVDEAQAAAAGNKPRLNPRLKRAIPVGTMAEQGPPREAGPPVFDDKDDEINYWQKELSNAEELLEIRKRAVKRMDKIRAQIESGARSPEDRERALDDFERRKGIVEKNLTKQEAQVDEIHGKLAALEG